RALFPYTTLVRSLAAEPVEDMAIRDRLVGADVATRELEGDGAAGGAGQRGRDDVTKRMGHGNLLPGKMRHAVPIRRSPQAARDAPRATAARRPRYRGTVRSSAPL